jgi:hypothetical protein
MEIRFPVLMVVFWLRFEGPVVGSPERFANTASVRALGQNYELVSDCTKSTLG